MVDYNKAGPTKLENNNYLCMKFLQLNQESHQKCKTVFEIAYFMAWNLEMNSKIMPSQMIGKVHSKNADS